ncbi:MAG: ATP-dependent helicase [Chloroflexota bacterium]
MQLTDEQQAVVRHPIGQHARVLAVAGAGKTTTMAHRVRHLLHNHNATHWRIGLLMFNKLARQQFESRLSDLGLPENKRPRVNTFHSFAYHVVHDAIDKGVCDPIRQKWFNENSEQSRRTALRLIQQFEREKRILYQSLDVEEMLMAISLWKGALIPPDRAGYKGNKVVPDLYLAFEEERLAQGGVTFDDLIPMAVTLLETEPVMQQRWRQRFQHLIVDEYQDVNYSQQRLIELLAGEHADVMVVGDDDQTIYEWRGARPSYLIRQFKIDFDNKPVVDYTLSHSFRFGPLIAQYAQNVIQWNEQRIDKPVVAHHHDKTATVTVIEGEPDKMQRVNEQLADIAQHALQSGENLIVLGRLYSQMTGVELAFLTRQQPYRVEGNAPLLERREIVALMDYVRLAKVYRVPVTLQSQAWMLSTANTPNRKLKKDTLSSVFTQAQRSNQTVQASLEYLSDAADSPFGKSAMDAVADYADTLDLLHNGLHENAGDALVWLVKHIGYRQHFDDYYGDSETAEDRKQTVAALCRYAASTNLSLLDFLDHLDKLDTTHGAPVEAQIVLTSVHRVKGLEYDTVIIPDCTPGYMPCLIDNESPVYDKAQKVKEPEVSPGLDDERRLFYVALTRAKQRVVIGTVRQPTQAEVTAKDNPPIPSYFLEEMELDDTRTAIDLLQSGSIPKLTATLKQSLHLYSLTENAANVYLPAIGETSATSDLKQWLVQNPEPEHEYNTPASATLTMKVLETEADVRDAVRKMTAPMGNTSNSAMHRAIEKHPRAYQKWTDEEEQYLLEIVDKGWSIGRIADTLQRQPSAIRSRIKKIEDRGTM